MNKSTKWFLAIMGILVVVGLGMTLLFLAFVSSLSTDRDRTEVISGFGDKIAVVELTGEILSSDDIVRQFKKYRNDHSIKAILFRVDSPGGGVVASQEIYEEVRKTREDGKPVVVSMGALAASGGYYVSCGASRIVANPGTLTGSIGVISEFLQVDTLLHKIGVSFNTVKSGKFKDIGNPYRRMTPDDQKFFQQLMDDVHRQFMDVVEQERNLDHDTVLAYADGRVFTGEQAVDMGLVDTLGTYEDAVHIAAHLAGIHGEPAIVKEHKRNASLFDLLFGQTKIPDLLGLKNDIMNRPILQYRMESGF